ncbi:DUF4352 domain-containing protein [bacterium CPR1]|nr:DUF4352 domain-containing protein [bacterium CPR1]
MRVTVVLGLILLLLGSAGAQRANDKKATLKVVKSSSTGTANPSETMIELSVQVTNAGQAQLAFSNNNFVLLDDQGKRHVVNRGRYPERFDLAPGESATATRIFFTLPREAKPAAVQLILLRGAIGEAKL